MKKIVIIVVLIIVLIGLVFAISNNSSDNNDLQEQDVQTAGDSFFGSVKDLIMRGESLTCDFSREDENGKISGTVYVADEKFRGEFDLTDPNGNNFQTSVINDKEFAYTWGSSPFGNVAIKFPVEEPGAFADTDVTDDEAMLNPNEEFEYRCSPWGADSNMFTPPSDIEFLDFSQQLEEMMSDQCSVCLQIPDEDAQFECLKAFSCN